MNAPQATSEKRETDEVSNQRKDTKGTRTDTRVGRKVVVTCDDEIPRVISGRVWTGMIQQRLSAMVYCHDNASGKKGVPPNSIIASGGILDILDVY